jgi:hypothetical protein
MQLARCRGAVERKVVAFIREHWSKDICSFLNWLYHLFSVGGSTERGGMLSHRYGSQKQVSTTPLHSADKATLCSPCLVARADKEVADAVGLVVSEDELTAQVGVRTAYMQRLRFFQPLEYLEAQLTTEGELRVQFPGVMTLFLSLFACTNTTHRHRTLPPITEIRFQCPSHVDRNARLFGADVVE